MSSWKSQGRSFNSLVKRTTSGVSIRANDRNETRSNRNTFQDFNLPDALGTGIDASGSFGKLEVGKCSFGVEASNNVIFNELIESNDLEAAGIAVPTNQSFWDSKANQHLFSFEFPTFKETETRTQTIIIGENI